MIPMPMWFYSDTGAVYITFLDHQVFSGSASNHTFSSMNFGTAAANRIIVATIEVTANATFGTVTIGGVTAASQVTAANASQTRLAIFTANVPSGTSGDVVVNTSANALRWGVQLYSIAGQSSTTPDSTATSIAAAPTATLNVPLGGAVIGGALTIKSTTTTWTGMAEDVDETVGGDTTVTSSSVQVPNGNSSLVVTATFVSNLDSTGVWAVWKP